MVTFIIVRECQITDLKSIWNALINTSSEGSYKNLDMCFFENKTAAFNCYLDEIIILNSKTNKSYLSFLGCEGTISQPKHILNFSALDLCANSDGFQTILGFNNEI